MLVASAASPAVAQMLTHAADGRPVEDVVPAPPASNALGASVLPLVLGGILTGVLAAVLGGGFWRRTGLVVTGSVPDRARRDADRPELARRRRRRLLRQRAALSLTVLAIAATVTGPHALLGKAGIALGALTMVFVGNPFSGVATSPDMLPSGAGGSASCCRRARAGTCCAAPGSSTARRAGEHVAVLALWALLGLALLALVRAAPAGSGGGAVAAA